MTRKEFTVTSEAMIPLISNNCTQVIFQRHGDYEDGELTDESIEDQTKIAKLFMKELLNTSSLEELKRTVFLFIASPTTNDSNFKRCVATTDIAMKIIKLFFEQIGISEEHVINLANNLSFEQKIRESAYLEGSKIFSDNTGYLEVLLAKHGEENDDFWTDFDDDEEKEKRVNLKAEGPYDIADRGLHFLRIIKRYADWYHHEAPDSKLIVWCGTHYDIISPLVKRDFLGYEKTDVVYVDNCGGVSFSINENDEITANLNGVNYPFKLPEKKTTGMHY